MTTPLTTHSTSFWRVFGYSVLVCLPCFLLRVEVEQLDKEIDAVIDPEQSSGLASPINNNDKNADPAYNPAETIDKTPPQLASPISPAAPLAKVSRTVKIVATFHIVQTLLMSLKSITSARMHRIDGTSLFRTVPLLLLLSLLFLDASRQMMRLHEKLKGCLDAGLLGLVNQDDIKWFDHFIFWSTTSLLIPWVLLFIPW